MDFTCTPASLKKIFFLLSLCCSSFTYGQSEIFFFRFTWRRSIQGWYIYSYTTKKNVYNVLLFLVMDPELYRQLGGTLLQNKARVNINTHTYDIDLFNEVEEGSLLIVDARTADSLVEATVQAIASGLLKIVGVLPVHDEEAFSSTATPLKKNLANCSFWVVELIVVKPRTDWMNMPRLEGGNIPFDDISFVAAEMEALLRFTRGHRLLAIHMSGMVIKGPLSPASPSLKITASKDMCDYIWTAVESPNAAGASDAWAPARPTWGRGANHGLKGLQPRGRSSGRGNSTHGSGPLNRVGQGRGGRGLYAASVVNEAEASRPRPTYFPGFIITPINIYASAGIYR